MTPDDLARLKALAEAARDAKAELERSCATGGEAFDRAADAEEDAADDLSDALSPSIILALIAERDAARAEVDRLRAFVAGVAVDVPAEWGEECSLCMGELQRAARAALESAP